MSALALKRRLISTAIRNGTLRGRVPVSSTVSISSSSLVNSGISPSLVRPISTCSVLRKVFEPDYLDAAGDLPPAYPLMNIRLTGYDYRTLENYQKYVTGLCDNMGIEVTESWAMPYSAKDVKVYKTGGQDLYDSFKLKIYERKIQVSMRTVDAPLLVDMMSRTLPEGLDVRVDKHSDQEFENRLIPDPFIDAVKGELKQLNDALELTFEEKAAKRAQKELKKKMRMLQSLEEEDEEDDDDDDDEF